MTDRLLIKKDIDHYIGNVLTKFGLSKVAEDVGKAGILIRYKRPDDITIQFTYDFKESFFYFGIYLVIEKYNNKEMGLWKVFMEIDPTLDYSSLHPEGMEYMPALKKNSELLTQFLHLWLVKGKDDLIKEILE